MWNKNKESRLIQDKLAEWATSADTTWHELLWLYLGASSGADLK